MSDEDLIRMTANTWIQSGGDAEGFLYLWEAVHQKIVDIEKEGRDE